MLVYKGSERVEKSGVTGLAMKEAQHINKSLSALGNILFQSIDNFFFNFLILTNR